ncbi:hypothetical protein RBS60_10955 [Sinomonas sp. ASV486]|uniref:hypothetical protein n=1 Tax=Sinomonas sp. ASV486 TaxID=3051170 RepID=UPI0027DC4A25|nr:hypothetical protein [Sinomonas sp. ASV486]MDQ4490716.1 hypothetical protein [Sinomonas sp. ASV486]
MNYAARGQGREASENQDLRDELAEAHADALYWRTLYLATRASLEKFYRASRGITTED